MRKALLALSCLALSVILTGGLACAEKAPSLQQNAYTECMAVVVQRESHGDKKAANEFYEKYCRSLEPTRAGQVKRQNRKG